MSISRRQAKSTGTSHCNGLQYSEWLQRNEALHTLTWKELQDILFSKIITNNGKVLNNVYSVLPSRQEGDAN